MNPNFHSESLNMTMDRGHEQMYGQDFGKVPLEWQQYMQNQMISRHNQSVGYFNESMYSSQGSLHQMAQQSDYGQMNLDNRKLEQERMGTMTPQGTTTPVPPTQHFDVKQEQQLNQLNQYADDMMQYSQVGNKAVNYSQPSPRNERALNDSPEKRNSPSVSMTYSRTPEMQTSHYTNEANQYVSTQSEKSNIGHNMVPSLQERVSLSPPKARNSPAVTSPYEVKEENLQSNYEKDMMQYVAQIDKVSNPSYIGTNTRQDAAPVGSPGEPRNSHTFTGSYNSSHHMPPQNQIPPPTHNQIPPQSQYEMLQFLNAQQNVGTRNYSGASTRRETVVRTPEQRVSPSTSPYVSKPDSSSVQHSGQMSQYMAAQANMNFNDRTRASLPPASDKSSSPSSMNSFSVKQEISQSHCSEENVNYGYSSNQVAFNSASPKLEAKSSPYDSSQETSSASVYPDMKPQVMHPNMGMFQYGGFNPYTASHLPSDQIRSQYPGHMPMPYYGQTPFPGSQMSVQGQIKDESKNRMMPPQQQYYSQSYPSNYEMALNTQRYFQQGMMGNQWQAMQENCGQMMGYGKRKITENGDNCVTATTKKSRGYNDEDYDFELCNNWDEVTKVTPDTDESQNDGEGKSSENSVNSDNQSVRTIFTYNFDPSLSDVSHKILLTEQKLCEDLKKISFKKPILHIYNPLVYAFESHLDFVRRYCNTTKTVLFLGMNPGPFGMSQNGIPFGEVSIVRDWFNIRGQIHKPSREHHKRQIMGLQCQRSEVSGSRFWGLFKSICGSPDIFFKHCFVYNICPMAFISPTSKNITPAQLPVRERTLLYNACNAALLEVLKTLDVKIVVAIGKFAEGQAVMVANDAKLSNITIQSILHPSPINPAANRGWESAVLQQLTDMDVMKYFTV